MGERLLHMLSFKTALPHVNLKTNYVVLNIHKQYFTQQYT